MGFFSDLFGTSGAATDAANAKISGLQQAQKYADPLLQQGQQAITSGYGQAQNLFAPLVAGSQAGAGAYGDITGANGPEGYARALQSFQTSPGYDFTKNAALQATQRIGGTGGNQNSGGVQMALQDRAAQLANTEFGNYVSRLQPYLGYNLAGTAGAAGQYSGEGTALNTALGNQAQLGYGTQAGIGSAQAAGTLGEAQANQAALNSLLSFGGQLLGYGSRSAPAANYGNLLFGGGSPSGFGT
jgi:hypothetical protein